MAFFNLYLDTRAQRQDGTYPLKIVVTHKRNFMISLKVYTTPDKFIGGEVLIPGEPIRQKSTNRYIYGQMVHIENELQKLTLLGELSSMTDKALKQVLDVNTTIQEDAPILLKDHFLKCINQKEKKRTREVYQSTYDKIAGRYDLSSLLFSDINIAWLKGFEAYMAQTCGINSRAIHLRNLRAVFNDAIDEEVIDQNTYPFRKFKIKKEVTRKPSLSVDQLRTLRDYPCEEYLVKYRDMFMLIFYLIGINAVDLFQLEAIKNV